jgi:hypothetical protein
VNRELYAVISVPTISSMAMTKDDTPATVGADYTSVKKILQVFATTISVLNC